MSVLAVAGKTASGLAVGSKGYNRWAIGFGMVPRGEVGLIFAQIGLSSGAVEPELYAAVVLMVIATTFASPLLLKKTFA
ncbi:MAG: cation:proton antiporter [Elusimicrobiota bacterium]|nr:MAG: cation:proton antiporter [Elusimicrobiota bacterium]